MLELLVDCKIELEEMAKALDYAAKEARYPIMSSVRKRDLHRFAAACRIRMENIKAQATARLGHYDPTRCNFW
jgi:hypothetical protein